MSIRITIINNTTITFFFSLGRLWVQFSVWNRGHELQLQQNPILQPPLVRLSSPLELFENEKVQQLLRLHLCREEIKDAQTLQASDGAFKEACRFHDCSIKLLRAQGKLKKKKKLYEML